MEEPLERDRAGGNATPPSQNEIPSCAEIKMTRGCTRDSIVGHYQQFQHKLWRVGAATWRGIYTPCLGESSASPGPTMPSTLSSMAIIHGHRRHGHRGHGHRPWPSKARVSSTAINHGYHPQLINAHHPLPFPTKCHRRPQREQRTDWNKACTAHR